MHLGNKEIWAPLPDTLEQLKEEVEYIQRELFIWNRRQPDPRMQKNIILSEFNDLDFGIAVLLEGRKLLIGMRERWMNSTFKRVREHGRFKVQLNWKLERIE